MSDLTKDCRNLWRSALSQGVLPSSISVQRKPHLDSGGITVKAYWRGRECGVGRGRSFKNYQGRKGASITLERGNGEVLEKEPRYLCMDPRRYAKHWQWCDRASSQCQSNKEARPAKVMSVCPKTKQSNHGRSREAPDCKFYLRGLLPQMACQCHYGEEVQRLMEDVHGFHKFI